MENNQHYDYTALIGKYLSGEASPEEALDIHEWIQVPENKSQYDNYVSIWNGLPASSLNEPNSAQVWSELESKLKTHTIIKKGPNLFFHFVAAACTIAFVGALAFFLLRKPGNGFVAKQEESSEMISATDSAALKQTLKDGTNITLNKNSSLAISNTYNATTRKMKLSGEGYFEVTYLPDKPFILSLDSLLIEAAESSFNVKELSKEGKVEVQVKSGSVSVYANDRKIDVNKNQTGIFDKRNRELKVNQAIDLNSLGYATGSFYFNDISLIEACRYLADAFNVEFHFKDKSMFEECRITAEFTNKPLNYILDVMAVTLNITFNKKDRSISILGKGCN